ncbi:MAG TPA: hypothetical protein VGL58_00010 [Caulobacteraceae bacterium]
MENILKEIGPSLSGRICKELEAGGLSSAAARQRISRVRHPVNRLGGLIFPKGAKFLYLDSQRNTRPYWEALIREAQESSPAYAAALAGLLSRGGVVPLRNFPIVCGSPIRQAGHLAAATILDRLTQADLVRIIDVVGIGECVSLGEAFYLRAQDDAALRARLLAEKVLISAVKDWVRKLGVASYDTIRTRDDNEEIPKVGTFAWDLSGPSYLRHMVRRSDSSGRPVPGFFVCDLGFGEHFDEAAVAAFVRKCETVGALKKLPPIWSMLVAESFSREAFNTGRSHGVMMATPDTLFGKQVAEGLRQLVDALTRAAAIAVARPEAVGQIFDNLSRIEGAAINLRGPLFEMIVGHCVVKVDGGSIDIGRKVLDRTTGKKLDVDVFRVKGDTEVWAYECKGYQPSEVVKLAAVEHWLTERVARIHDELRFEDRFQSADFHYEFWTTGDFAPDALARLEEAKANTKRYTVGWRDGPAVREYASRVRHKEVLKMLDDHYFNHPIARLSKRYNARAPKALDVRIESGPYVENPIASSRKAGSLPPSSREREEAG